MAWMITDYVDGAYRSLKRSRMRTFLTTLGIAIGVGSVTAVLALSGGLTEVINKQIDRLDGNLLVVRPGATQSATNALTAPANQQSYTTSTLSETDVFDIQKLPQVEATAPLMTFNAALKTKSRTLANTTVVATTPDFAKISRLEARDGQFLDNETTDRGAILGRQLAVDLFGTEKPIGFTFTMRNERFTILGVLSPTLDPVNYNRIDFDNSVFIPFETGKILNQGRSQIQQIDVRARDTNQLEALAKQVRLTLLENHSGEEDFFIHYGKGVGAPTSEMLKSATGVMAAIAAISLFVGGVGIMNIMLVGVAERTREIGIRKAVGATSGNIAAQFLIESVMVSLFGGFLGYFIGYIVAFGISTYLYFVPSVNWQVAATAALLSFGVGVLFGLYPALRAARKHPIESLRQYH